MKIIWLMALPLAGCASVISGTSQDVYVKSNPQGAECSLTNDKGAYFVLTPKVISIHRSVKPLEISCLKGSLKGRQIISIDVDSDRKGWSMLGGGMIGLSIDKNSGAAYAYPDEITVELK